MTEKMKRIILIGFKGDCCGRHYNRALIKMALQKKIELICVDYGEPKNVLGNPPLKEMTRLIKEKKVQYLDLQNSEDLKEYKNLSSIDMVFVVTPDITHCKVVQDFLGKARRIFIDKPLDAILRNVRLLEVFPKIEKIVFGQDHYLAKFYPFQVQIDQWLDRGIIGEVKEIEFRLLEPPVISSRRIRALDAGMIYDLFSHGIAVVAAVPSKWAYPDPEIFKKLRILKVQVAKYFGCRIKGCTYAKVEFEIPVRGRNIFCAAKVGKGIGKKPSKILKITGSRGEILVDIDKYSFVISDIKGKIIKSGKLFQNYAEAFLSAAIDPKKPLCRIPGAMPFAAAKEILFILDEAEWKREPKGRFPRYAVGSSISEIETIIKDRIEGK